MDKKITVKKKANRIDIYRPCKYSDNFIHFDLERLDRDSINFHQWKMMNIYVCTPGFNDIIHFASEVEWEGAILEEGAADFIGGYHGDERCSDFVILADTKLINPEEDFEITCQRVRFSTVSYLDRCDTPNDVVFLRFKDLTIDLDGYTIHNRYKLTRDFEIKRFEGIMMGMPLMQGERRFVTMAASNTNPVPVFIDLDSSKNIDKPIFRGDHDATSFEVFAPDFNFYAKVEGIFDIDKYPNGFRLVDNWRVKSDRTFKAYFNNTGKYSGKKDEIFEMTAKYTLEG